MSRNWNDLLEDLANLESEGLADFRQRWPEFNRCDEVNLLKRRDELRTFIGLRSGQPPLDWRLASESVQEIKEALRALKSDDTEYSKELSDDIDALGRSPHEYISELWLKEAKWVVNWSVPVITAYETSLSAVLCHLCVRNFDRLAACGNPGCKKQRYFLADRNSEKFCSKECSKLGRRLTKWKWWHEHRSKAAREAAEQASEGELLNERRED